MYENKQGNLKKGYILLYTLLICSLCMIISLYLFSMQIKNMKSVVSYKNYILKDKEYEDSKEYLFTKFYQENLAGVENLNLDSVKNLFTEKKLNIKTEDRRASIEFDSENNKIILKTYYDAYYYRQDTYDYKVIANRCRFIYLQSIYVEGRID